MKKFAASVIIASALANHSDPNFPVKQMVPLINNSAGSFGQSAYISDNKPLSETLTPDEMIYYSEMAGDNARLSLKIQNKRDQIASRRSN